jgi:hypothetical protein
VQDFRVREYILIVKDRDIIDIFENLVLLLPSHELHECLLEFHQFRCRLRVVHI